MQNPSASHSLPALRTGLRSFACWCLLVALGVVAASAAPGRLRGVVVDESGQPIPDVVVTARTDEVADWTATETTNAKGKFLMVFQRAQYKYVLGFEADGYLPFEQEIQPTAVRVVDQEFVMQAGELAPAAEATAVDADLAGAMGSNDAAVVAFNAGLTAQRGGDLSRAQAEMEAALAADAELVPAWVVLAQVRLDQKNAAEALVAADRALALRPGHRDALRLRYESLRALGRRAEAKEASQALEAAEDASTVARLRYNEGAELFQSGDKDAALVKFEEAATLDPQLFAAHHARAGLLAKKGDLDAAILAAERAVEIEPDNVKGLQVLYDIYTASEREEEALALVPRLAAANSDFGAGKLMEQASESYNAGDVAAAAKLSRQALAIDESAVKAHYFLGLEAVGNGDNTAARDHFSKFLAGAAGDPDAATAQEMMKYLE